MTDGHRKVDCCLPTCGGLPLELRWKKHFERFSSLEYWRLLGMETAVKQ